MIFQFKKTQTSRLSIPRRVRRSRSKKISFYFHLLCIRKQKHITCCLHMRREMETRAGGLARLISSRFLFSSFLARRWASMRLIKTLLSITVGGFRSFFIWWLPIWMELGGNARRHRGNRNKPDWSMARRGGKMSDSSFCLLAFSQQQTLMSCLPSRERCRSGSALW